MEFVELVEVVSWTLWVGVGIIMALVSAGFYGGRRMLGYDLATGVITSILGGWCSSMCGGDMTKGQLIVSVLVACLFSGIALVILNWMARPRKK